MQNEASARNQSAIFQEERAKEDRDNKAEIYIKFLDAANNYASVAHLLYTCTSELAEESSGQTFTVDGDCAKLAIDLRASWREFQTARNSVYFFGSEEAERKARVLAAYLPDATSAGQLPGDIFDLGSFNFDMFSGLYRDFQRVACMELPANPRKSC